MTELGGNGGNGLANSFDRTVEVCGTRFDDDGLNCEGWRESLRLEGALGVVRRMNCSAKSPSCSERSE